MQDLSSLMSITKRPAIVFERGKGAWLWDQQGKAYLDFIQGWAVNCLGHSPDLIIEVLEAQAKLLINPSPGFYNRPMLALADLLRELSCFDQVFFANSGAEANEGAIKLARKWGKLHKGRAYKIITFENGFHGRTLATMSATGKPAWAELYEPKVPGFVKVAYNDIEAVVSAIDKQTVAIMLEPIQGEAGVIPAQRVFIQQLRELCYEHGLLLIFDEVQTGIGRCGELFAYQYYDVEPDVMTLGKGLGGGVPLAALLVKAYYSCFAYGDQGGTFNGNPLMTAVGLAVLQEISQNGFLNQVRENAEFMRQGLLQISSAYGLGQVRGVGMLLAMETTSLSAPYIVAQGLERGLILNAPREHTLRFMPALNVSQTEIEQMFGLFSIALNNWSKSS